MIKKIIEVTFCFPSTLLLTAIVIHAQTSAYFNQFPFSEQVPMWLLLFMLATFNDIIHINGGK